MSPTTRRARSALAAFALALSLGIGGCAAHPVQPSPTPTTSASVTAPAGGVALSSVVTHAPDTLLTLPRGLVIDDVIDQPNVITLTMTPEQATRALDWLSETVATTGWTVTGQADDALTFTAPGWDGALTFTDEVGALTLRRV